MVFIPSFYAIADGRRQCYFMICLAVSKMLETSVFCSTTPGAKSRAHWRMRSGGIGSFDILVRLALASSVLNSNIVIELSVAWSWLVISFLSLILHDYLSHRSEKLSSDSKFSILTKCFAKFFFLIETLKFIWLSSCNFSSWKQHRLEEQQRNLWFSFRNQLLWFHPARNI